ncbi:MAG: hypothetical protein WBE86_07535 [Candidatus Acidiferrales bacterium]
MKRTAAETTTMYIFSDSKVIVEYDNGAAVNSPTCGSTFMLVVGLWRRSAGRDDLRAGHPPSARLIKCRTAI